MTDRRIIRRSGRSRRPGGRSPTDWDGTNSSLTLGASSKLLAFGFVPIAGVGHETCVRIVGEMFVETSAPTAVDVVVLGAAVVSDQAFTVGITAVPDPITEIGDDMWTFINPLTMASTAQKQRKTFDSRAMRKIEEGQTLAFVWATGAGTGASVKVGVYLRVLFKHGVRS